MNKEIIEHVLDEINELITEIKELQRQSNCPEDLEHVLDYLYFIQDLLKKG